MAERGQFYLNIVEGNNKGEVIPLQGDVISLGAGKEFAVSEDRISFVDSDMSGEHAVLIWQSKSNTYMISNRCTMNPILVNGSACGHTMLVPDMVINISNISLKVSAKDYEGPANSSIAPARLKLQEDLYLGENLEKPVTQVGTPAWLLQGGENKLASANKAWDSLSEEASSKEQNAEVVVRPAYAPDADATKDKKEDIVPAVVAEPEPEPVPEEPAPVLLGTLTVVKGKDSGASLDVYGDVTIGRSPDCDLVINDGQVSRIHCSITFEDGDVFISNLSNSNTTHVGRSKIKKAKLLPNADIMLASRVQLKWTKA